STSALIGRFRCDCPCPRGRMLHPLPANRYGAITPTLRLKAAFFSCCIDLPELAQSRIVLEQDGLGKFVVDRGSALPPPIITNDSSLQHDQSEAVSTG